MEVLCLRIKQETQIKGNKINRGNDELELKLSMCADDSTFFLYDEEQVQDSMYAVEEFGKSIWPKAEYHQNKRTSNRYRQRQG